VFKVANDFKNNLKGNINMTNEHKVVEENTNTSNKNIEGSDNVDTTFILKKKTDDKKGKKIFNVYMDSDRLKELDKACKKSGYSRNELVNVMVEHCINNLKLEE
jgi:hypothetical protein